MKLEATTQASAQKPPPERKCLKKSQDEKIYALFSGANGKKMSRIQIAEALGISWEEVNNVLACGHSHGSMARTDRAGE